ncbi:N-formylglutamate amidohydrolase [Nostoc sp. 3335mG]|nr:N-formylglutamate amidohydrolase [Nostoc sp. 3335mG]
MDKSVTDPAASQLALWSVERAHSPLIGTAIHDGHLVWPWLVKKMALDSAGRLREEDPFTAQTTLDVPNRITVHRSRFEVDLNRGRDLAVYLKPEQAWGLEVWRELPSQAEVEAVLDQHAGYYSMLHQVLSDMARAHGRFVLLDMHSYNHRRGGSNAQPTPQADAPDINIGTSSMDRSYWAPVVDALIDCLRKQTFLGRPLDVRENVAFQGKGEQTRFVHEHFHRQGCAIAIEFKKIFMDEWTGRPDWDALADLRTAVTACLPVLEAALDAMP